MSKCMNSCRLTFIYWLCAGPRPDTVQIGYTIGTSWLQCRSTMASCQWTQMTKLQAVSWQKWHKVVSCQWTQVTQDCKLSEETWQDCKLSDDTDDTRLQAVMQIWQDCKLSVDTGDTRLQTVSGDMTRVQAVSGNRWQECKLSVETGDTILKAVSGER